MVGNNALGKVWRRDHGRRLVGCDGGAARWPSATASSVPCDSLAAANCSCSALRRRRGHQLLVLGGGAGGERLHLLRIHLLNGINTWERVLPWKAFVFLLALLSGLLWQCSRQLRLPGTLHQCLGIHQLGRRRSVLVLAVEGAWSHSTAWQSSWPRPWRRRGIGRDSIRSCRPRWGPRKPPRNCQALAATPPGRRPRPRACRRAVSVGLGLEVGAASETIGAKPMLHPTLAPIVHQHAMALEREAVDRACRARTRPGTP